MATAPFELAPRDYTLFRTLVYDLAGIDLGEHKLQLVKTRLTKRLRTLGIDSFRQYYEIVKNDQSGDELTQMLDAISTNLTFLFREPKHFDRLRMLIEEWTGDEVWRRHNPTIRIWSAACSSGEEPHTIAMVAHDALKKFPDVTCKILATDLSTRVLSKAKLGIYSADSLDKVPPPFRKKYFQETLENREKKWQIAPDLRRMVTFARMNLMTPTFPFKQGFHVIFCRNVMIYFDRPTQETLIGKLTRLLLPGGHLMVGHSESLNNIEHSLQYVEPATYCRPTSVTSRAG